MEQVRYSGEEPDGAQNVRVVELDGRAGEHHAAQSGEDGVRVAAGERVARVVRAVRPRASPARKESA